MRKIELLAPAKTAEIGIEAFRHGADAVYIGAPAFSARAAAGTTVADIARLAEYGHLYGAKTIVAFNTILTDPELVRAERMMWELHEAGVDALIIQDLGLLQLHLPPIELHASTQTDNRTLEKVRLMHQLGMSRVVMARELSIEQIRTIHEAVPDVELECFVHGALCVSISGQCYMSAAMTGRSANRGECAQPCRLPMDLLTPDGQTLVARQRHLLSLRDMNRSAYIEQLVDAGVTSLKIEGRLKEMSYVKNVVAYYRQLIDRLLEKRPDFAPLSEGRCHYTFEPRLEKSFNRSFTSYFAEGQREPMWNFMSPKSMGERVGQIVRVNRDHFVINATEPLHNGDGLAVGEMGFRLNRYDPGSHACFPLEGQKVCQQLRVGQVVYRNLDIAFEQLLDKPSAKRLMPATFDYSAGPALVSLTMQCGDVRVTQTLEGAFEPAARSQEENIHKQLSKLGDTPFEAVAVQVTGDDWFVPSSMLADLRRQTVRKMLDMRQKMQTTLRNSLCAPDCATLIKKTDARGILPTDFRANVLNQQARKTFAEMGLQDVGEAFEIQSNKEGIVMQTKHCLKYAFGQCPRYPNPAPEKMLNEGVKLGQAMELKIGGRKFILKFGCKNDCISEIFTIFAAQK